MYIEYYCVYTYNLTYIYSYIYIYIYTYKYISNVLYPIWKYIQKRMTSAHLMLEFSQRRRGRREAGTQCGGKRGESIVDMFQYWTLDIGYLFTHTYIYIYIYMYTYMSIYITYASFAHSYATTFIPTPSKRLAEANLKDPVETNKNPNGVSTYSPCAAFRSRCNPTLQITPTTTS